MKQLCIFLFSVLLLAIHFAEGQTTFQKLIIPAVPYSSQGEAIDICSNGNNGYVIVGSMRPSSSAASDVTILNMDQNGYLLWSRTFGNPILETGHSIQLLPDNNIIILGTTGTSGAPQDLLLMKIDNSGNILLSKSMGSSGADFGYSIANTIDSGLILTGFTISNGNWNFYLIKSDSEGIIQWAKTYGDTLYQAATCVKECVNGDFILTGGAGYFNASNYNYDIMLIRTDNQGVVKWSKTYGELFHGESGYDVIETNDGGFLVSGSTTAAYGNATLLKTDSLGNVEWFHLYGGYFNPGTGGDDEGKQVLQSIDGSFYLTGTYVHFPYTFDPSTMLVKVDSSGNILWSKYYKNSTYNRGNCLYSENNNELVVGGTSYGNNSSNVYLMQVDLNGNSGCFDSIANISIQLPFNFIVNDLIIPQDTIAFTSLAYNLTQNNIGIDSTICLTTGLDTNQDGKLFKFNIYPNPFSNSTFIESDHYLKNATIELFNITGNLVRKFEGVEGDKIILERANLPEGIYGLLIQENGKTSGTIKVAIIN